MHRCESGTERCQEFTQNQSSSANRVVNATGMLGVAAAADDSVRRPSTKYFFRSNGYVGSETRRRSSPSCNCSHAIFAPASQRRPSAFKTKDSLGCDSCGCGNDDKTYSSGRPGKVWRVSVFSVCPGPTSRKMRPESFASSATPAAKSTAPRRCLPQYFGSIAWTFVIQVPVRFEMKRRFAAAEALPRPLFLRMALRPAPSSPSETRERPAGGGTPARVCGACSLTPRSLRAVRMRHTMWGRSWLPRSRQDRAARPGSRDPGHSKHSAFGHALHQAATSSYE